MVSLGSADSVGSQNLLLTQLSALYLLHGPSLSLAFVPKAGQDWGMVGNQLSRKRQEITLAMKTNKIHFVETWFSGFSLHKGTFPSWQVHSELLLNKVTGRCIER